MELSPTLATLEEIGYNDVPVLWYLRNSILVTLSLTQKPEESNSKVEVLSWQNCLIDNKFFLIEGIKIFFSTNDLFRVCKEVSPIWVLGSLFPLPTKILSCPTYGVEHVRLQQSCYLKLQSLDIRVSHLVHVHLWLWKSEDVVGSKGMVKLLPTLKSVMIKFAAYMRNVFGYKGMVIPLPTLKSGMINSSQI